jgi:uncharacterized protein
LTLHITNSFEDAVHVSDDFDFSRQGIAGIGLYRWVEQEYPVVYLLRNRDKKMAYIGESSNGKTRIGDHLSGNRMPDIRKVNIIGSDKFNRSATLDIESRLIQYMLAEGTYIPLNSNGGHTRHNYYQDDLYRSMFRQIWQKMIKKELVFRPIDEIEKTALFKYSPYKALNTDQYNSVIGIIEHLNGGKPGALFVNGAAGTGKTILATYLIKLLVSGISEEPTEENALREYHAVKKFRERYRKPRIALVVAMASLRETLKKVFSDVPGLTKNMIITPSQAVRSGKKYDLLLVDEAHRLRQRRNQSRKALAIAAENNRRLELPDEATELDWIPLCSAHQVFFYDPRQSVKPSDVPKKSFDKLLNRSDTVTLTLKSQMRIEGGTDYIEFIDRLLDIEPEKLRGLKPDPAAYDFQFFDSFGEMHAMIMKREKEYGLSRIISGYSWPWKSRDDASAMDIDIEGMEFQWNQTTVDWIDSPGSVNEIGCIHTTQGYDLNYAGVVFGKEIIFDPEARQIRILRENYHDRFGWHGASDEELKEYIVNIYRTILSRGIRGTYVYACDPALREYLRTHIDVYNGEFPFRKLEPEDVKPYVNSVPCYDLKAAAGAFAQRELPREIWIELPEDRSPREGMFVCQVLGESMNNAIPNGAWCLFGPYTGGTRNGEIVLIQETSIQDPDYLPGFTVKRYYSEKAPAEESWRHRRIELRPDSNEEFEPIILEPESDESYRVVGIFRGVLKV